MNKPLVHVKDLEKEFRLSHSGIASIKSLLLQGRKQSFEHLHVLKGVSFDIPRGECAAIIGRNGAGKSTLLSLLAQVYKPTSGEVQVNGRIAPLLELGAGFHPDLTGLENIFINGIILGMSRAELESRIDAIVEFSELYNQIDSPVRTYSSGMSARLGFSIAVHVDAEVLLVDEVLAVGDFAFREKCFRRLDELKKQGLTIVLVSHGGPDIRRIADRCIWLQEGLVEMDGDPKEVLEAYEQHSKNMLAAQRRKDLGAIADVTSVIGEPEKEKLVVDRMSHVNLFVRDPDESLKFYTEVLGFKLRSDVTHPNGVRWIAVTPPLQPDLQVALVPVEVGPLLKEEDVAHLEALFARGKLGGHVFMTKNFAESYETMLAKGVKFTSEPIVGENRIDVVFFDNSGNWLRMTQTGVDKPKGA